MNTKLHPKNLNGAIDSDRYSASHFVLNAATKMGLPGGFIAVASVICLSWMHTSASAAIGANIANASNTKDPVTESTAGVNNIADPAQILRARYPSLRDRLNTNGFQRPIVLDSFHSADDVKGEIYAVVPTKFGKVNESLAMPQAWCDILILHLNTKYCRVVLNKQVSGQQSPVQPSTTRQAAPTSPERSSAHAETTLVMNVGKKFDRPLDESYRLTFAWQLADQKADYFRVQLNADEGPLSTRDYRITLEAIPLPMPLPFPSPASAGPVAVNGNSGATLLHLSYSYQFGLTGKIAMLAYLSTVGRAKVGFTVVGKNSNGDISYVDGLRGLVERNTMRYHLAIESYLGALAVAPAAQFEKRISDWYAATERYPRQLHEVDRSDYIDMKRKENQR